MRRTTPLMRPTRAKTANMTCTARADARRAPTNQSLSIRTVQRNLDRPRHLGKTVGSWALQKPFKRSAESYEVQHYVLTWDCKSEELIWLEGLIKETFWGKAPRFEWSVYNTQTVKRGDRAFFLRQRLEPRGLIGLGSVLDEPHKGVHWKDPDKEVLYVTVEWEYILEEPLISYEELSAKFPSVYWKTQRCGISCKTIGADIEALFKGRARMAEGTSLDVQIVDNLIEGAIKSIMVNSFERNINVRSRCIRKWGYTCVVCKTNLQSVYGEVARRLIHIHHLTPLAALKASHSVDPENDLRPVCPNCHSVIHRREPPYSIEEMRGFLQEPGSKSSQTQQG